jgi:hypothetical protein
LALAQLCVDHLQPNKRDHLARASAAQAPRAASRAATGRGKISGANG